MKINLIYFGLGVVAMCIVAVCVIRFRCKYCNKLCKIKNCSVKSLADMNLASDYDEPDKILRRKLYVAFEEKKLYRCSDLTLEKLAVECGTNRTYLSEYLNRKEGKSFTDFVNDYRIDAVAIKLMYECPHMSVSDIAMLSGFGSVATFRRAFVRRTGMTPSEFKETVHKKVAVKQ